MEENICITTKALLKSLLNENNSSLKSSCCQPTSSGSCTRLPKMYLSKMYLPKYADFKNIWGLFDNLVHSEKHLPNIEKFNHLVSCL